MALALLHISDIHAAGICRTNLQIKNFKCYNCILKIRFGIQLHIQKLKSSARFYKASEAKLYWSADNDAGSSAATVKVSADWARASLIVSCWAS